MKQFRLALLGWFMLVSLSGCVRLGYDAHRAPRDPERDGGREDAGKKNDSGVSDASMRLDASGMDASKSDGSVSDGGKDAGKQDGGDNPKDASMRDGGESDASMQHGGASDSGPMDSGSEDAAMPDAEVDSGPEPTKWCPERSDAVICDDFESGTLSRWEYSVMTNGSVNITTARTHSGTYAAIATTTAAMIRNSEARRGTAVFDNKMSGDIWLRYWYYVPSSVSVTYGFSQLPIAELEMPYFGFAFQVHSTDVKIGVLGTHYDSTPANTLFPRDQWVCVETHVKIDGSQGVFEAYMNGTLAVTSGPTNTLPEHGYSALDIGIHYASVGQGPVTAYIDDVIAGYKRYGCN